MFDITSCQPSELEAWALSDCTLGKILSLKNIHKLSKCANGVFWQYFRITFLSFSPLHFFRCFHEFFFISEFVSFFIKFIQTYFMLYIIMIIRARPMRLQSRYEISRGEIKIYVSLCILKRLKMYASF